MIPIVQSDEMNQTPSNLIVIRDLLVRLDCAVAMLTYSTTPEAGSAFPFPPTTSCIGSLRSQNLLTSIILHDLHTILLDDFHRHPLEINGQSSL
jgi:hypothetical protein